MLTLTGIGFAHFIPLKTVKVMRCTKTIIAVCVTVSFVNVMGEGHLRERQLKKSQSVDYSDELMDIKSDLDEVKNYLKMMVIGKPAGTSPEMKEVGISVETSPQDSSPTIVVPEIPNESTLEDVKLDGDDIKLEKVQKKFNEGDGEKEYGALKEGEGNGRKLQLSDPTVMIANGNWGTWKPWAYVGPNWYACGAQMRFEDPCGLCDDTAANGLKLLFCNYNNWNDQRWVTVIEGNWGTWKTPVKCSTGKYITNAKARVEAPQSGSDDTSLNGLIIECKTKTNSEREERTVFAGNWGTWSSWANTNGFKFVSAAGARYEDSCGTGTCDDTALNGLQFKMRAV